MVLGKLSRDTANGSAATVRHQVSDAPLLGIPCLDSIINSSRAVGSQSSSPPPRPLACSTTSWDLKLARYEGHLGISASDYVLSARVRAWFFHVGRRQLERGDESVLDGVGRAQFHWKTRQSDPMASWSLFGRNRWLRSWRVPCLNGL